MREHADPRRNDSRKLTAGYDSNHAGLAPCCRNIDVPDIRMRVRRTYKDHMRHARHLHVTDIEAAPLQQPIHVRPRHGLADIGVRSIEHR